MKFLPKKSLKIPALRQLQDAFNISTEANRLGSRDLNAFHEERTLDLISRRKFIGHAAKVAAVIGVVGLYEACKPKSKATQPQIVIVGAGIAGLHAAYILKNA